MTQPVDPIDPKDPVDPKDPIEPVKTPVADVAPVLTTYAAVSEDKLREDLGEKPVPPVVVPPVDLAAAVPAHHLEAAYKWLLKGSSVADTARIAGVPEAVVVALADEMDAVCTKLHTTSPVKPRPVKEAPVEEPVEKPTKEPIK